MSFNSTRNTEDSGDRKKILKSHRTNLMSLRSWLLMIFSGMKSLRMYRWNVRGGVKDFHGVQSGSRL